MPRYRVAGSAAPWALLIVGILFGAPVTLGEEPDSPAFIDEMIFNNQPVRDILLALGRATERSIVPDDTVSGTASYYFSRTTLNAALKAFLPTVQLYSWKEGPVRYVSRIRIEESGGKLSIDADAVPPRTLIERLSAAAGLAVAFRDVPREPVSVHVRNRSAESALRLIVMNLPGHRLTESAEGFSIVARSQRRSDEQALRLRRDEEGYRLSVRRSPLSALLRRLYEETEKDYLWMLDDDPIIRNAGIAAPEPEQLIAAVLRAGGARRTALSGFSGLEAIVPRDSVAEQHADRELSTVTIRHRAAAELADLLPQTLTAGGRLFSGPDGGSLVIYAEPERSAAIRRLIAALDGAPQAAVRRIRLRHISAAEALRSLPPSLRSLSTTVLKEGNVVVAVGAAARLSRLESHLSRIDEAPQVKTVQLQHLRAEELVAHLPPGTQRESVRASADPYTLFVRAPQPEFAELLRLIRKIDTMPAQLRFHLLIVEHYSSDSARWSSSFDVGPTEPGVRNIVEGAFGELLSLGVDVVSLFGYRFAARLNADIGENRARILADTVLRALPERPAHFEHTSTYRYRDPIVQSDGGNTIGAVTREIVSGISVELTGRPAREDSIHVEIDASLSKRGTDLSSDSGNPPPTTEKRLETSVQLKPGEPVALGGLSRVDDSSTSRKTPILGQIPLLGWLFRHATRSREDARTVIYLVGSIERREPVETTASRIRRHFDDLLREQLRGEDSP